MVHVRSNKINTDEHDNTDEMLYANANNLMNTIGEALRCAQVAAIKTPKWKGPDAGNSMIWTKLL